MKNLSVEDPKKFTNLGSELLYWASSVAAYRSYALGASGLDLIIDQVKYQANQADTEPREYIDNLFELDCDTFMLAFQL